MSQFFQVHPENPQQRLISRAVEIVREGGVIAYPTDSAYALGCHIGDKAAMEKIRAIRKLDHRHHLTLVCRDLSDVGIYAKVDNSTYRLLKAHTPGPYTFLLQASSEVPRRLLNPKRRTIGLRVPDNAVVAALLDQLGEPILSTTLQLPGEDYPMTDPYEIRDLLEHQLDLVIDGGYCGMEPTSIVDFQQGYPEVVRQGAGDCSGFA